MLDLFTIFSKGGIVLWCFQGTAQLFTPSVNALIRTVILQERSGNNSYDHNGLTLKYKLDNEFELVFVVAYQKILDLSYVDKFLSDIHLEFRDKYKDELVGGKFYGYDFASEFNRVLKYAEGYGKIEASIPKKMRSFDESLKSKKTVASMIENKKDSSKQEKLKSNTGKKEIPIAKNEVSANGVNAKINESLADDEIMKNRMKVFERMQGKPKKAPQEKPKSPMNSKEKKKSARVWANAGNSKDAKVLDFSRKVDGNENDNVPEPELATDESRSWVGQMKGAIKDMDYESSEEEEEEEEEEVEVMVSEKKKEVSSGKSIFSMFKGLVGSKNITAADMEPVLNKLRDHMITKNVASEIADQLCQSISTKLEGKVLGTFSGVTSTVRNALHDSLVKLLSPKRRIDILRDVLEAKRKNRPYVTVFCGVNGVGKSTNLAKIAFWLIENNYHVLIAACDTFRAGAVEQLRTHTRHLNALHPADKHDNRQMVQLYEKGYGKDAAGIAMEAITYARDANIDIVLVDTAGRMQDNEPLMRSLSKLIKVNEPDLVLFVGEALVGNEAVDQLTKFNQALADHSSQENPHLIDGIVLTKFDTIDDKVGASISMTYITGQPIVFVGTGQTYTDLKSLNPKAVVQALMK